MQLFLNMSISGELSVVLHLIFAVSTLYLQERLTLVPYSDFYQYNSQMYFFFPCIQTSATPTAYQNKFIQYSSSCLDSVVVVRCY